MSPLCLCQPDPLFPSWACWEPALRCLLFTSFSIQRWGAAAFVFSVCPDAKSSSFQPSLVQPQALRLLMGGHQTAWRISELLSAGRVPRLGHLLAVKPHNYLGNGLLHPCHRPPCPLGALSAH